MEFVKLTCENIEEEHICCAISNNKDIQVVSKKNWLKERLDEGLVFLKGNVRGKCFIEYIPAEYAWAPVDAEGYMYIDCLWVSGQFKGHGYANLLLDACIEDSRAKGKRGLVILSSKKKMGFLTQSIWDIRDFRRRIRRSLILNCCTCPLKKELRFPGFGTRKACAKPCRRDLCCIIRTNVLLRLNTCQYWRIWQKPGTPFFVQSTSRPARRRRMPLPPLQPFLFFMTGGL